MPEDTFYESLPQDDGSKTEPQNGASKTEPQNDASKPKKGQSKKKTKFRPTPLTSFEALVAGGDPFREIILRRANANFDKILADVVKEMLQQKLASLHYESFNNYVLFAPTMVITLLSAVISIVGTSELIHDADLKVYFSIGVACLQLVLSVLQSLSKQLNFAARAGFHRSASSTLKRMYQNATHARLDSRIRSMRVALATDPDLTDGFALQPVYLVGQDIDSDDESEGEKKTDTGISKTGYINAKAGDPKVTEGTENGVEPDPKKKCDSNATNGGNTTTTQTFDRSTNSDSLTKQFKQAIEQVDSFVPVRIANAFNVMETRIKIINESLMTNKTNSLVAWEQVMVALYHQLAETIIESRGFPFFIPRPHEVVDKTLENFKNGIDVTRENDADLLDVILKRSHHIENIKVDGAKETMKSRRMSSLYYQNFETIRSVDEATNHFDVESPLLGQNETYGSTN